MTLLDANVDILRYDLSAVTARERGERSIQVARQPRSEQPDMVSCSSIVAGSAVMPGAVE